MHSDLGPLRQFVERERRAPIGLLDKAISAQWAGQSASEIASGTPLLSEFPTPMLTLDAQAVDNNVRAMSEWCAARGVALCPHGKTTMSPDLWLRQLEAGAWGITVGNEAQLRVALASGVPRVMLANLALRADGLRWISSHLDAHREQTVVTWVDSVEAVALMEHGLSAAERQLPVCVEIGSIGGRTGARTVERALEVAAAVVASEKLQLRGIAGYEGVITHDTDAESLARIDAFFAVMAAAHDSMTPLYETDRPIITAGGSAYFDRVADYFGGWEDVEIVVRAGATVAHDDGVYVEMTPSKTRPGPTFDAALNVWARVISAPEVGVAYLDAGRRDVPDDEGLPVVLDARRAGEKTMPAGLAVVALNDQHAHVHGEKSIGLQVGDVVRLGVSHPCTTFDRWSRILVVDDAAAAEPRVVDVVRTYF